MFEKGDLVTYGCKGVCEVKNITTLNLEGIPKDRLYYEMQSMVNAGSRIFSPVGQEEKNAMRAVLTKEEAEELLGQLPERRAPDFHRRGGNLSRTEQGIRKTDCCRDVSVRVIPDPVTFIRRGIGV